MKQILAAVLTVGLALSTLVRADVIQIDVTKLSPEQLKIYQELKQIESGKSPVFDLTKVTPDQIEKYASIGKAFGTAFKECWSTVSADAEKFGQSDAGKVTMVLIAWKIMGDDAINLIEKSVQYSIGIPLFIVGTWFFIYISKRNCISRPSLKSCTKIWFFTFKKEFNGYTQPIHGGEEMLLYGLCYGVFIAICCTIIFVG